MPASNVPSEQASPTQPFPVKPTSLSRQRVSESDLTPKDLAACRRTFRELRNEGVFTPPDTKGSLHVPGNIGGLHWGVPLCVCQARFRRRRAVKRPVAKHREQHVAAAAG